MKSLQHLTTVPKLSQTLQLLKLRNNNVARSSSLPRRVSFCADECHKVRTFETDEIPIEELWFTYEEFQTIKKETRVEARKWRRMECDKLLHNAFNIDVSNRDGVLSKNDQQFLINVFCAFDDMLNKRGLERQCNQKLAEERSEAKTRSKYAVLDTQKQYKRRANGECVNVEQMSKSIAAKYVQSCKEAKQYARRMAIGDEHAVLAPKPDEQIDNVLNVYIVPKQQRRLSNYSASTVSSSGSSLDSRLIAINRNERIAIMPTKNRLVPTKAPRKSPWNESKELYAAIA